MFPVVRVIDEMARNASGCQDTKRFGKDRLNHTRGNMLEHGTGDYHIDRTILELKLAAIARGQIFEPETAESVFQAVSRVPVQNLVKVSLSDGKAVQNEPFLCTNTAESRMQ